VTLPDRSNVSPAGPARQGATRLAQVVYDGDWRPDPLALVRFAEYLRDELSLDVVTQYREIRLTDPDLYTCPILFLTGHSRFELSEAQAAALRSHLSRGGFLFAEACCGRAEFDRGFRAALARVFPDRPLERLGPEHVIFRGSPGFAIRSAAYRPALVAEQPELNTPVLFGLEHDGRLAVVYSPYSIACGLDGHECHDCRGLMPQDARRLAANIVLYALTH
jgi:hypothetical protein